MALYYFHERAWSTIRWGSGKDKLTEILPAMRVLSQKFVSVVSLGRSGDRCNAEALDRRRDMSADCDHRNGLGSQPDLGSSGGSNAPSSRGVAALAAVQKACDPSRRWFAAADDILASIERLCVTTSAPLEAQANETNFWLRTLIAGRIAVSLSLPIPSGYRPSSFVK